MDPFVVLVIDELAKISALTPTQTALIQEHVYGGLPSIKNLIIRNGYVFYYNLPTMPPIGSLILLFNQNMEKGDIEYLKIPVEIMEDMSGVDFVRT